MEVAKVIASAVQAVGGASKEEIAFAAGQAAGEAAVMFSGSGKNCRQKHLPFFWPKNKNFGDF